MRRVERGRGGVGGIRFQVYESVRWSFQLHAISLPTPVIREADDRLLHVGSMKPIRAGREALERDELVQIGEGGIPARREGPPAELIFGEWYPALRSEGLHRGDTALATLLGIPLLVGRKNDGSLFCLRDLCPHRGIPLSAGWFDGETVMCKYHGWRFEPCSGRCEEIPSLTSHDHLVPQRIFANAFPVRESDGYAWVYVPEVGSGRVLEESTLPVLPEVPKFGGPNARFRS